MALVKLRQDRLRSFGRTVFLTSFLQPMEEGRTRMLRRQRRWAIYGSLLGLFIGIVLFLPASLVATQLSSLSNQHVQLAEVDGTVWHGSGLTVLTGGRDSHDPPSILTSRLEWWVRPHWNGISLKLAQPCCLPQGLDILLQRQLKGWRISVTGSESAPAGDEGRPAGKAIVVGAPASAGGAGFIGGPMVDANVPLGEWPASLLIGLGAPANTLQPNGLLSVRAQQLAFVVRDNRTAMEGHAQFEIRQASSRITTLDTLGSYRLALDGSPTPPPGATPGAGAGRTRITLTTLDGALILDGNGEIGPDGAHFHGTARAAPGSEAPLNNLLNIIGRRNGALSVISIG
ncbi:MAG TPA: type II secretion system protein N [Burkholderiaceae bacterium]|jgi:general secretion pathway protein N|nr:type II secretion system protein N [Burkholderiaceae bacterium]